ncbi:MAG: hypothetical protein P1V97_37000 [Planctomycetota bacterium]|nr:hypothetical protein [Planctomycetota bacterium]
MRTRFLDDVGFRESPNPALRRGLDSTLKRKGVNMSFTGQHSIAIGHFKLAPGNRAINCYIPLKSLPEMEVIQYLAEHPLVQKKGDSFIVEVNIENVRGNQGLRSIFIPIEFKDGIIHVDVRTSDYLPGNTYTFPEVFELALQISDRFQVKAHVNSAGGLEMPKELALLERLVD